jgi:hypothetical protein
MALRADIESGAIAVAAAITAGGVEAFQIWPATKRVTVAADRDETKQGAGYKRGERAARKFGLINHERVEVHIALPGEPGQSVDWLHVLLRGGRDAVRSGILDPPVFEPNAEEAARDRELKMVAKTFPLPSMDLLRLEYRYTRRGEIWVHKFEGKQGDEHTGEKSETWTPVASPMGVPALLQMADADDAFKHKGRRRKRGSYPLSHLYGYFGLSV